MTRLLTVLLALAALAVYPAALDEAKAMPPTAAAAPIPTTTPAVPRPTVPAGPTTIAVVGDSILMQAWQQVHGALSSGGYVPEMVAKPASGLAFTAFFDWDAELRRLDAAARPDQLVVQLGTNDLGYPGFYESGAAVGFVMRTTSARRVVWVLPSADPGRPDRQPGMERIRSALQDQAADGPYADRLDLVDFGREVAAVPGTMEADLVHVTPYGAQLLADLIRSGVDGSP
jgi:lysophospholipase L1-like esterase